ncbi:hypothetical protein [Cereibacter sphaeroides]|uniref:hypothetical protein n=1 Tax=Cereibacter sphaeroides TaxID=1063 RepID=UPI001559AD57|nr:hypothetical protein [Cereibacter sphaeroides]
MSKTTNKFSPEVRERAVRLVLDNEALLEPIGNIPPAEAEAKFYAALDAEPMAA